MQDPLHITQCHVFIHTMYVQKLKVTEKNSKTQLFTPADAFLLVLQAKLLKYNFKKKL